MNDTEQLIKEALGKLAERTPHPGPTLNALRRKRKRQRNVFMIAAAGMAAVVVLIFAGVVASDRYTPPSGHDAAAALVQGPIAPGAWKYRPHWLPDGFGETFRGIEGSRVSRVWSPAGTESWPQQNDTPNISFTVNWEDMVNAEGVPEGPGWQETTVRGLKAWLKVDDQSVNRIAWVTWRAQDLLTVSAQGVDDVRAAAMRVADSVRADSRSAYQSPLKLEGSTSENVIGKKPGEWTATLNSGRYSVVLSRAEPDFPSLPSTQVTVRGKQATAVSGGNKTKIAVKEGEWWLSISARGDFDPMTPPPVEDVIAMMNKVELVPSPDTNWIGKGL